MYNSVLTMHIESIRKYNKKVKMLLSSLETVKSEKHLSRLGASSFVRNQQVRSRLLL